MASTPYHHSPHHHLPRQPGGRALLALHSLERTHQATNTYGPTPRCSMEVSHQTSSHIAIEACKVTISSQKFIFRQYENSLLNIRKKPNTSQIAQSQLRGNCNQAQSARYTGKGQAANFDEKETYRPQQLKLKLLGTTGFSCLLMGLVLFFGILLNYSHDYKMAG